MLCACACACWHVAALHRYETDGPPEEEVEERPETPEEVWTLYGSIWGPRCEWCDGRDFYDHDEVVFERFALEPLF